MEKETIGYLEKLEQILTIYLDTVKRYYIPAIGGLNDIQEKVFHLRLNRKDEIEIAEELKISVRKVEEVDEEIMAKISKFEGINVGKNNRRIMAA